MSPADLRDALAGRLLDFAWSEWSQMGIPSSGGERSPWAQDPEALFVFSLEVARDDPRLFDLLLGWLATNESLLSTRRLRAMRTGPADERLLNAALGWSAQYQSRESRTPATPPESTVGLEPLFPGLPTKVLEPDPAFAAAGFLRNALGPATDARQPSIREPINLAFRLRHLLGVSVRAEVVRHLLTVGGEHVTTQAIAASAGYSRRNVQEALGALRAAGVIDVRTSPGFMHWGAESVPWMTLLGVDELPDHRDWPHLLAGLRAVLRWLRRPELDGMTDYLLKSQARDLLEDVRGDFQQAGVSVGESPVEGAWQDLETVIDRGLELFDRDSAKAQT